MHERSSRPVQRDAFVGLSSTRASHAQAIQGGSSDLARARSGDVETRSVEYNYHLFRKRQVGYGPGCEWSMARILWGTRRVGSIEPACQFLPRPRALYNTKADVWLPRLSVGVQFFCPALVVRAALTCPVIPSPLAAWRNFLKVFFGNALWKRVRAGSARIAPQNHSSQKQMA